MARADRGSNRRRAGARTCAGARGRPDTISRCACHHRAQGESPGSRARGRGDRAARGRRRSRVSGIVRTPRAAVRSSARPFHRDECGARRSPLGAVSIVVSLAGHTRPLSGLSSARVVRLDARRLAAFHRCRACRQSARAGLDGRYCRGRATPARLGRRCAHYRSTRSHRAPMRAPTLNDIYAARTRVYRTLRPTPLLHHPLLAAEAGLDIRVKHENHNPTGAFKVRGGLNLIGSLSAEERRGVITATTGNHGQSIALACQREGVPCTIVTPVGNNPEKNAAMRAYGADVLEYGTDFDEAREHVEAMQAERGLRYVHSANEPMLIAGVGTYALEIFQALPDVDV